MIEFNNGGISVQPDKGHDCSECIKQGVCKFREDFSEYRKHTEKVPLDMEAFTKTIVQCKHYHQKPQGGIR